MDTLQTSPGRGPTAALVAFLAAPLRPQTYRNLTYLALQFPLGIVSFTTLVATGATAFAGVTILTEALPDVLGEAAAGGVATVPLVVAALLLVVVAVGLGVVGVVAVTVAGVALFTLHRLLTGAILDESLPASPVAGSLREAPAGFLRAFLGRPGTYLATLAALATFPIGIAALVATLVPSTLAAVFLAAPFVYDQPGSSYQLSLPEGVTFSYVDGLYTVDSVVVPGGIWTVDTMPEALALAAVGVGLVVVGLNAFNLLAWALGRATAVVSRHATTFWPPAGADESTPDA